MYLVLLVFRDILFAWNHCAILIVSPTWQGPVPENSRLRMLGESVQYSSGLTEVGGIELEIVALIQAKTRQ